MVWTSSGNGQAFGEGGESYAGGGRTQPFTCSVLLLVCLVGVALKCCVMCIVLSLVVPYRSIAGSCKLQKKIKIKIKKILQYSIT